MTTKSPSLIARRTLIAGAAALVARPAAAQSNRSVTLQRLSWAGVKIEAGATAAYIDATKPLPEDHADHLDATTRQARRYALVTHGHADHFDIDYLHELLGDDGVIFCHRQTVGELDARVLRIQPVDFWEPAFLPRSGADMVAYAVPAVDGFGSFQASWVIRCGDKRLIHCGDTLWHGEWFDIAQALGPFDVALLPINGARQEVGRFRDVGAPGVLTPELAVAAARALSARTIIPIHYGRSSEGYTETPRALEALSRAAREFSIVVRPLAPGDRIEI